MMFIKIMKTDIKYSDSFFVWVAI